MGNQFSIQNEASTVVAPLPTHTVKCWDRLDITVKFNHYHKYFTCATINGSCSFDLQFVEWTGAVTLFVSFVGCISAHRNMYISQEDFILLTTRDLAFSTRSDTSIRMEETEKYIGRICEIFSIPLSECRWFYSPDSEAFIKFRNDHFNERKSYPVYTDPTLATMSPEEVDELVKSSPWYVPRPTLSGLMAGLVGSAKSMGLEMVVEHEA